MDKIIKDFEESSRKLDKVKSLLHTAGNIEVGNTPHEVVGSKREHIISCTTVLWLANPQKHPF